MIMNKQTWESRLIDYIDGKADATERALIEQELSHNEAVRLLYNQLNEVMGVMNDTQVLEPSGKLKVNFEKALQTELTQSKAQAKTAFFSPMVYRIAAGFVFVMISVGIGYWINLNNKREQELADLRKQVEENRRMMLVMLDNQQSASQRMVGISVAYELEQADDEIVRVLVKTMNEDSNSNVRLAALDALSKFSNETIVRTALINSLEIQKDPVVQIALIQQLVMMKEKDVVKKLEEMTHDAGTMKAVKDEAYAGILKLS